MGEPIGPAKRSKSAKCLTAPFVDTSGQIFDFAQNFHYNIDWQLLLRNTFPKQVTVILNHV